MRQWQSNEKLIGLGIFSVSLFLFCWGLRSQEIIGFEARFYLFAETMWRHGLSLFPMTYAGAYPDYPVTTTALIYCAAKLFGGLNKFTAVLPSAIAAALTLMMTYFIGALQFSRLGWYAVCFLLMTMTFITEARTISPDLFVAFVTTSVFYLIYSASILQKEKRLWAIPFLLAFSFACRGPIGVVIPAAVICIYYALEKEWKSFFKMGLLSLFVLILGSLVLFYLAYLQGGYAFMQDVLRMQVAGRLQDAYLPWYFYFKESFGAYALTYPLAILLLIGVVWNRSQEKQFLLKLVAWVLIILIGMTIPAGKKTRYILSIAPALSLISAYWFLVTEKKYYLLVFRKILHAFILCLPLLCLMSLKVVFGMKSIHVGLSIFIPSVVLMQLANMFYRNDMRVLLATAAMAFVMTNIFIVEPINLALNRTASFVTALEKERVLKGMGLAFYHQDPDTLPIKYLVDAKEEVKPTFIPDEAGLMKADSHEWIVSYYDDYFALSDAERQAFGVVGMGQIGHEMVMVVQHR